MKRVNYHMTARQRERLAALSSETGLSVAELVRRAVDAMLEGRRTRDGDGQEGGEGTGPDRPVSGAGRA